MRPLYIHTYIHTYIYDLIDKQGGTSERMRPLPAAKRVINPLEGGGGVKAKGCHFGQRELGCSCAGGLVEVIETPVCVSVCVSV